MFHVESTQFKADNVKNAVSYYHELRHPPIGSMSVHFHEFVAIFNENKVKYVVTLFNFFFFVFFFICFVFFVAFGRVKR